MSRIICVSNRVSLPDPETGEIKAGGLAVGVKAALECCGGGLWIGWDGGVFNPDAGEKRKIRKIQQDSISFFAFSLSEQEYACYYKAMANEKLWPFMHGLAEHIEDRPDVFETYRNVNRLFARLVKLHARPGDKIWVHDYHLIPLGKELRSLGAQNSIAYFHHIPIPRADFARGPDISPLLKMRYDELANDLFSYDLVGLQSFRDFKNFSSYIGHKGDIPRRYEAAPVSYNGMRARAGVFPISVEAGELARKSRLYANSWPEIRAEKERYKILIGAERLDYTKGLTTRLEGYAELLRAHPEHKRKVKYHQITPLSREDIEEYKDTIAQTRNIAKRIEKAFGERDWRPLDYSEEMVPREKLIGAFRHSDVGLVTPLIDGQNLVAKEYLAAQDPSDPGVLVLSRYAGAAEELERLGALCVEPNDPRDIAAKIDLALKMPLAERMDRYRKAMAHLYRYDISHWAESFLNQLADASAFASFPLSARMVADQADSQ